MSNNIHNYLENKPINIDKILEGRKKMETGHTNGFTPKEKIEGAASILKADEARLKEIAQAFAKNEQKIVARELDTDILMLEVKRRFDEMQIRLNSIKSAMGEE